MKASLKQSLHSIQDMLLPDMLRKPCLKTVACYGIPFSFNNRLKRLPKCFPESLLKQHAHIAGKCRRSSLRRNGNGQILAMDGSWHIKIADVWIVCHINPKPSFMGILRNLLVYFGIIRGGKHDTRQLNVPL